MTGWDTIEQAWEDAQAIAREMGATEAQLMRAGCLYMERHWPDGDPSDDGDVMEAVAVLDRLNLLRDYLEELI